MIWSASDPENDFLSFNIFFGKHGSMSLLESDFLENRYELPILEEGVAYQWEITATDNHGNSTASGINNFGTSVEDIDGNQYRVVKINTQTWMAENIRVTHYPDGSPIALVENNDAWGSFPDETPASYCFYLNIPNEIYGGLYTWKSALGADTQSSSPTFSGVQGICPNGWHIPTNTEWDVLINGAGGGGSAGHMLKEAGNSHWLAPAIVANDAYGFLHFPQVRDMTTMVFSLELGNLPTGGLILIIMTFTSLKGKIERLHLAHILQEELLLGVLKTSLINNAYHWKFFLIS